MIRKAIAKLKNKRASDRLGWRAEWLKEGGEEIVESLSILFNRIEKKPKNTHTMEANNNQKYI